MEEHVKKKKRPLRFKIAAILGVDLIILLVLEITLRLLASGGDPMQEPGGAADGFGLRWLKEAVSQKEEGRYLFDPELFWKNRPNDEIRSVEFGRNFPKKHGSYFFETRYPINGQGLLGRLDRTPEEEKGEVRILSLGDSSTFGVGIDYPENVYSSQLERILQERAGPGKRFSVLNGSVVGYSSQQGRIYFESPGIQFDPHILLLYFGNNDCSAHTTLSDREILLQAPWREKREWLRNLLSKSYLFRALEKLLSPSKREIPKKDSLEIRVRPGEYRENLRKIIRLALEKGIKVVLVDVPVPLDWPPMFFSPVPDRITPALIGLLKKELEKGVPVSYYGDETFRGKCTFSLLGDWNVLNRVHRYRGRQQGKEIDFVLRGVLEENAGNMERAREIYAQGLKRFPESKSLLNNLSVLLWKADQKQEALSLLKRLGKLHPGFSVGLFNLGRAQVLSGHTERGMDLLRTAREQDWGTLRIKDAYRKALASLAEEFSLPLIPAHREFERYFEKHATDSPLFQDFCHPSTEGHRIIATMLAETILRIL